MTPNTLGARKKRHPVLNFIAWLQRHWTRATTLIAGVFLLAVPTVFTVFPGLTDWDAWLKTPILFAWGVVAALAGIGNIDRDIVLNRLIDARVTERTLRRNTARTAIITTLLESRSRPAGIPASVTYELYLYDKSHSLLTVAWPRMGDRPAGDPADPRCFEPGKGATGRAWREKGTVHVKGDSVSDGAYDLTPEQRELYREYRMVCATPMVNSRGDLIGVLTALSKTESNHFDDGNSGQPALERLALVLGVAIGELAD